MLQTEVQAGRVAGPFQAPPFNNLRISPLGLVPPKQPNKFRLIHHLSCPSGSSINDGIPAELATVQYANIDDAVKIIRDLGLGCFLANTHIKSAFRIITVAPHDHCLLGFRERCFSDLQAFLDLCAELGVPIAQEKTMGSNTSMVFACIELDTVQGECRLPQHCHSWIDTFLVKKKGSDYLFKFTRQTGNAVIADKGFDIQDQLAPRGNILNIPPFIIIGTGQPSEPAHDFQTSQSYGEFTDYDDNQSDYPSARHFAPINTDDEFESVSQVHSPRRPVWHDDDDNFQPMSDAYGSRQYNVSPQRRRLKDGDYITDTDDTVNGPRQYAPLDGANTAWAPRTYRSDTEDNGRLVKSDQLLHEKGRSWQTPISDDEESIDWDRNRVGNSTRFQKYGGNKW
uniref:Uncharacterized protein LOC100370892 n=1 Tax=Saccoglossus kowalevskii TaxID=10224 RepID=A0ABM0LYC1_SACKO|nr:PREDICTED: uncharacterized protein LOC100370892 [Saccoglossus kowalevskii]